MRLKQFLLILILTTVVGINAFGQRFLVGGTPIGTTMSVCAGTSITITADPQASGSNQYSWDGGTNPSIPVGATTANTIQTFVPISSPYVLTCYFFNGITYKGSVTVTITVNTIPSVTGIQNFAQCSEGAFTLISSNSPDDMSFLWQMSSDNGSTWGNVAGATNNSLVLSDLTSQNGKQYRSIASYSTGCSDTTGVKTLTVNPALNLSFTDDAGPSICKGVIITYGITNNGSNSITCTIVGGVSYLSGSNTTVTITIAPGATGHYTILIPDADPIANFAPTYIIRDLVTNCYY